MEETLHEIRICTNPECGFRFPVSPTEKRMDHCPKCGAPAALGEAPYHAFSIRGREPIFPSRIPLIAVLDNIRSAFNVGAMFRTADGAGFSSLSLCGITPTPFHPRVKKTALGAELSVPWEHSWDVCETVSQMKKTGTEIWALEGGDRSIDIFDSTRFLDHETRSIALVVGNEVSGVDPEVVKMCDHCVYIPMEGCKESLNVAIAFGIAAYLIRYGVRIHE